MSIWKFETKRFKVIFTAEEEHDIDLSFDETGEISQGIDDGEFVVFCAKVAVEFDGKEIGTAYLGNCIYKSYKEFVDHVGLAIKSRADGRNYGSQFRQMVSEAIEEAREHMKSVDCPPVMRGEPVVEPILWIAVYEHKHGLDMRLFKADTSADEWKRDIAKEYWFDAFDQDAPDEVTDDMAKDYFEHVDNAFFSVQQGRPE